MQYCIEQSEGVGRCSLRVWNCKFLSHYILFMYSEGEIPSDFLNTLLK